MAQDTTETTDQTSETQDKPGDALSRFADCMFWLHVVGIVLYGLHLLFN